MSKVNSSGCLIIESGTEYIKEEQFANRGDIKTIIIPSSVKRIEKKSFYGCKQLKKVVFLGGSRCELIGDEAFARCYRLEHINFPPLLQAVGTCSFLYDVSLKELEFPNAIKKISRGAFYLCYGIEKIAIKNKGVVIEGGGFERCVRVKKLIIGEKAWDTVGNWSGFSLALNRKRCGDFLFLLVRLFSGYSPEEGIIGDRGYNCIGTSGKIGEGYSLREAYEDYLFLTNRKNFVHELDGLTYEGNITMRQFRIINGACLFGTIDNWIRYVPEEVFDYPPVSGVYKVMQNAKNKYGADFLDFFDNHLTPQQLYDKIEREERENVEKTKENPLS